VVMHFDLLTLTGWCRGSAWASYDSVNGEAFFSGALVSGAPSNCVIDGVLTSSPTLTIVP
jgi:hypothetical protein